jgi:hypothetical protein
MAVADLRILLDRRLVQDLRFSPLAGANGKANMFLTQPTASVEEVLAKYGNPARQNKSSLIYWKIGFSVKDGKIVGVFSAPF